MNNDSARSTAHRSLQWLAQGWQSLRNKAMNALTYFSNDQKVEKADSQRWAVVAADLVEHDKNVVVELELPGMDSADLTVDVMDNRLLVSGEKRSEETRRQGAVLITERAFGRFQRVVPLPCDVDRNKAVAEYRKGVLKVELPKIVSAESRQIPIKHA